MPGVVRLRRWHGNVSLTLDLGPDCRLAPLADINARIAELERIRDGLQALVAACPGHGRPDACPILNALQEDRS